MGLERSRVQEPSGLAALLIPHCCVCSASTTIYTEPQIPPLPLPSAGQRPAHLSGMSCDEIYINREDGTDQNTNLESIQGGAGKCCTELVAGGQRGSLGKEEHVLSGPQRTIQHHHRCRGAHKAVPLAQSGTADGSTRQPEHCSTLDTGGPCQEGEDRDLPRRHPGTPDNTNATHLSEPPFPPVPTAAAVLGFLPTFLTHTCPHVTCDERQMPTVTCDERQRHPHFPMSLHVLTDTGVWPPTGP